MNPRFAIHQFPDGWCIFDLREQKYVRHIGGTHIVFSSHERASAMMTVLNTTPPIQFTIKQDQPTTEAARPDCSAIAIMKDDMEAGSRQCGTCHKHVTEGFVVTDDRRHLSDYFRFVCSPCSLMELAT